MNKFLEKKAFPALCFPIKWESLFWEYIYSWFYNQSNLLKNIKPIPSFFIVFSAHYISFSTKITFFFKKSFSNRKKKEILRTYIDSSEAYFICSTF